MLSSSPTLSPSTAATTPSLQQTTFTFPTPPHSNSSTPQPLSSPCVNTYHSVPPINTESLSPHTPTDPSFAAPIPTCDSGLQGQMSAHSLLTQPISDPTPAQFDYPSLLPPNPAQAFPNQNQLPAPSLSCSFPTYGNPTSFAFPPHLQNLSFPNMTTNPAHPALHLSNLSHQSQGPSLTTSFPHSASTLSQPQFQPVSAPSNPQSFPNAVAPISAAAYPSVDIGIIPQFNSGAPYRPDIVLHHPSLLPQLDLPSTPAPAIYPPFSSYPLRLCQETLPSLSIPLRHLYRQHQHGPAQGAYLDMSARAVF